MTREEICGVLRQLPPTIGGMIAGAFLVIHMKITADDIKQGIDAIIQIGGVISSLGGLWLTMKANSKASIVAAATKPDNVADTVRAVTVAAPASTAEMVKAVNSLPEVKGVVTTDTLAGIILAAKIPSPTVAPAGTSDAESIARS